MVRAGKRLVKQSATFWEPLRLQVSLVSQEFEGIAQVLSGLETFGNTLPGLRYLTITEKRNIVFSVI